MSGPAALLPINQALRARHPLKRETFQTSRLLDFCSERELVKQIGHPVDRWPLVILKELLDNAIDAAEEVGTEPAIRVEVTDTAIVIFDNGPGIPAKTISGILDFSVRISSREAYCSPTRYCNVAALAVYDAHDRVGSVVRRDDRHYAYTAGGKLIGVFWSRIEAAPAIPAKESAS